MEGHAGETNRVGAYNHKRAKTKKKKQNTRGKINRAVEEL